MSSPALSFQLHIEIPPWYTAFHNARRTPAMPLKKKRIKLYTLSTCSHCMRTKRFFKEHGIDTDIVDVDLLNGAERERIIDEVRKLNPECSFPTICIDDEVIVGFNEEKLRKALDLP
jgi:glutaredoxin-like protein NrdH